MVRTFISIDLPDSIKDDIYEIGKILDTDGIKLVEHDNLHLTLKFTGEVSQLKIDEIIQNLSKIRFKPFRLKIQGVGAFPTEKNARIVWIGAKGYILPLVDLIETELERLKFKRDERFHPHITIARIKKQNSDIKNKIEKFLVDNHNLDIGSVLVDNFRLKKSILTGKGPTYETIKEFKME